MPESLGAPAAASSTHAPGARWGHRLAWAALVVLVGGVGLLVFGTTRGCGIRMAAVRLEVLVSEAGAGRSLEGAQVSVVGSASAGDDLSWLAAVDPLSEESALAARVRGLLARATTDAAGRCGLAFSDERCECDTLGGQAWRAVVGREEAWGPVHGVCVITSPGFRPVRVDLASEPTRERREPAGTSVTIQVAVSLQRE